MRRQYIYPTSDIQPMCPLSVLCESGGSEPTSEFSGGTSSGNAGGAHAPQRPF